MLSNFAGALEVESCLNVGLGKVFQLAASRPVQRVGKIFSARWGIVLVSDDFRSSEGHGAPFSSVTNEWKIGLVLVWTEQVHKKMWKEQRIWDA